MLKKLDQNLKDDIQVVNPAIDLSQRAVPYEYQTATRKPSAAKVVGKKKIRVASIETFDTNTKAAPLSSQHLQSSQQNQATRYSDKL